MERCLGLEVPDAADGVLQDMHWGAGLFGYFPTYSIGNLMAGQLWERAPGRLPDLDARIEQGDFAPLREWLREHVHRTAACSRRANCFAASPARTCGWSRSCATCAPKLADSGVLATAR